MWSNRYDPTRSLELNPSYRLALLLALLHAIALLSLIYFDYPIWAVPPLSLAVVASAIHSIRLHALKSAAAAVVRLTRDEADAWRLHRRGGRVEEGVLMGESYLHRFAPILLFKVGRRMVAVVIWSDSLDYEQRRRLVVRLRSLNPGA